MTGRVEDIRASPRRLERELAKLAELVKIVGRVPINPRYPGRTGQGRARGGNVGQNTGRQSGGLFGPTKSSDRGGGGGNGGSGGGGSGKSCPLFIIIFALTAALHAAAIVTVIT